LSELSIRPARAGDEPAWRELWAGYCEYYEVEVPEDVTAQTWRRLLAEGGHECLVAERAGEVVGFANYLLHPSTWSTRARCYLEDLFVAPAARGAGAGRALIEALRERAREHGWREVYWHTEGENVRARGLYDSFVEADGFVRYVLKP
jgi:GNAT superfamily N-acetyltransferase